MSPPQPIRTPKALLGTPPCPTPTHPSRLHKLAGPLGESRRLSQAADRRAHRGGRTGFAEHLLLPCGRIGENSRGANRQCSLDLKVRMRLRTASTALQGLHLEVLDLGSKDQMFPFPFSLPPLAQPRNGSHPSGTRRARSPTHSREGLASLSGVTVFLVGAHPPAHPYWRALAGSKHVSKGTEAATPNATYSASF